MEKNCHIDREKFEFQDVFSKKTVKLKLFCIHVLIYVIGAVLFILKEYYGVHLNFFLAKSLNYVVMIIWTCVFLFSAIDLIVSYTIFGEKWEERKLKSILEKKQQKQKWV